MLRPNIFGKSMALNGDKTSTEATCIATINNAIADGKAMLRVGDPTTECPKCRQVGQVITGENRVMNHGKAQAVHGSIVRCGCPHGTHFVIADDPVNTGSDAISSNSSSALNKNSSFSTKKSYHIRYLCKNDNNGALCHSSYYFYLNNGERIIGKTNGDGYTEWYEFSEQEKPNFHIIKDY